MQPRRRRPRHLTQRGVDEVGRAGQLRGAEHRGLDPHALELVGRQVAEHRLGGVPRRGDDDEVAQPLEHVLDEAARLVPRGHDAVDDAERAGAVARGEGVDRVVEQGGVRVAEQRHGALVVDPACARAGDQLVEHRQRVAHRAAAGTDHERQHPGPHGDPLGDAQLLEVGLEGVRGDEAERVVVRARADGPDDLVRLRRGEDELHVRRRLLDDLEQRVEPLRGDHVRLVEDEDLEPVPGRGERRALAQVTRVVDAVVARSVDLDDVQAATAAARELDARVARAARHRRRALGAVEAAREDPGRRRLAAASRTGEQVGVGDLVRAQRLQQGLGDVLLPDHLGEGVGPVAAVQGLGHGTSVEGATDGRRALSRPLAPATVSGCGLWVWHASTC